MGRCVTAAEELKAVCMPQWGSFGVACVLHWGPGTVRRARRVGNGRIACGAGACGDRLDGSYRDLKPSEFVGEAEGSNRRESFRGPGCCRCCWAGRESLTHAEHERMASHACALAFFWTKTPRHLHPIRCPLGLESRGSSWHWSDGVPRARPFPDVVIVVFAPAAGAAFVSACFVLFWLPPHARMLCLGVAPHPILPGALLLR